MIRVQNLTVRYPRSPRAAPQGLSLKVNPGETVLLLGPSGCGKSTLAYVLTGLVPHDLYARVEGRVEVAGRNPQAEPPGRMAVHVGYLLQDPEASFATLVVEDEVAFGLENLRVPRAEMEVRVARALAAVGMEAFRHRRLDTLSGGEAQRVALAALLAMQQPILVLDEPTANLDPQGTRDFFDTLGRLRGRHTLLLIEHKVDACLHLVDRVVMLDETGRVLAQGPPRPTLEAHRDHALRAGLWLPQDLDPRAAFRVDFSQGFPRLRTDPPAVAMQNVSFGYPGAAPLLRDITLTIPQGDFLAVVGPNGAGKSTLAHLMLGLKRPQQGRVRLFGHDVQGLSPRALIRYAGLVFQNPEHQFVTERVWDELAYTLRVHGWDEARIRSRVTELLERFRLTAFANHNPFRLSQGQKRRLSVGTMLAGGPRLLIFDEPTFGQDRNTAYALMDLMLDLNREGVTIVFITHDLRLVRQYARHVLALEKGRVVFHGPTEAYSQLSREMGSWYRSPNRAGDRGIEK